MARLFNGTNQSMTTNANITFAQSSFTMAFWLWYDSYSNTDKYVLEKSANYTTSNSFRLAPGDIVAAGTWGFGVHSSNGFTYGNFTRPSAAAWHQFVLTAAYGNTTALTAYVDGVAQTITYNLGPQNDTGITFDTDIVFAMSRNNASNFVAGRICEIAFWNGVVLTASEAKILGLGYRPSLVRPGSLTFYAPFLSQQSPEIELVKANVWNLTNAPTTTPHPAVLYDFGPDIEVAGSATSAIKFKKTLSPIGTKVGSKQVMGV